MTRRAAAILSATALLCACGSAEKPRARPAPLVEAAPARAHEFVDRIEAVGTARADEQVTVSAPVTERILRLAFDDGDYVREGQVLAVLAQAQENAALANAQAQARVAAQQLARIQALKSRGFATNASVDTQVALATSAQAQAAEARAQIGDRVIRAPFAGWASLRTISRGAVVTAGTPIVTISDIRRIKLDFTVPETMLRALAAGQPIVARAAAFPDTPFAGRIATIDPVIDPSTRAVLVRALLPNPALRLKPGMLLTVTIEAARRTAPAVPELAVLGEGDRRYVYAVGPDLKARRVTVRTGLRDGGLIEIVSGLAPGQRVIGEGVVKVSDGMTVRLKDAGPRGSG